MKLQVQTGGCSCFCFCSKSLDFEEFEEFKRNFSKQNKKHKKANELTDGRSSVIELGNRSMGDSSTPEPPPPRVPVPSGSPVEVGLRRPSGPRPPGVAVCGFRSWTVPFKLLLEEGGSVGHEGDFTFFVGEERQQFVAHSLLLALRSSQFDRLIDRGQHVLTLIATLPKVFHHFLQYIYVDDINENKEEPLSISELYALLYLAQVYRPGRLLQACLNLILRRVKAESNACQAFELAKEYKVEYLQKRIFECIVTNAAKVIETKDFLCLSAKGLEELMQRDEVTVSEIRLFDAFLKWKAVQSREVLTNLGPILEHIRFPLMTKRQFSDRVVPAEVLPPGDVVELLNFKSSPKTRQTKFCTRPRNLFLVTSKDAVGTSSGKKRATEQNAAPPDDDEGSINVTVDDVSDEMIYNYNKQQSEFESLEAFIHHMRRNPERALVQTRSIQLGSMRLNENHKYETIVLPNLQDVNMDLVIPIRPSSSFNTNNPEIVRFERYFDIRKYLFYRKKDEEEDADVNLEELLDSKNIVNINIVINGVTMLRLNYQKKELFIGFRNDAATILSGSAGMPLQKLGLMKSDVPRFKGFPYKNLKEVSFFHLWVISEMDVRDFIKNCPSLEVFCCWVVNTTWENRKLADSSSSTAISPTELNLDKDLRSGSKLEYLALCKVVLSFSPPPQKVVKDGITKLFLDTCFFTPAFEDNIAAMFPNLEECAFKRDKKEKATVIRQQFKCGISVRLVHNLVTHPKLKWLLIWGMNWDERLNEDKRSPVKKIVTRNSNLPVSDGELSNLNTLLQSFGLREKSDNFILERDELSLQWRGQDLNDREATTHDNGCWNKMDELDFRYFRLEQFFKDHQAFQNYFQININELP